MKHEYTLFKRKGAKVWYMYYYEGSIRKKASTGKVKKFEAEQFAQSFLETGTFKDVTVQEYAQRFFLWDSCQWIKRQHAKGRPFSKAVDTLRNIYFPPSGISPFPKSTGSR